MKITKADESHVPDIIDIWEEFAKFHEDMDPRYPMADDVRVGYEEYLRGLMKSDDNLVVVAVEDGKVTGFAIAQIKKNSPAWVRKKYGFIDEMAVKEDYRRKGTGARMLKEIMDWFKSKDIDLIELDVAATNPVGYPFWRKHGFKDFVHRLYMKL